MPHHGTKICAVKGAKSATSSFWLLAPTNNKARHCISLRVLPDEWAATFLKPQLIRPNCRPSAFKPLSSGDLDSVR